MLSSTEPLPASPGLLDLPDELLLRCLSGLDVLDLLQCQVTCQRLRSIAADTGLAPTAHYLLPRTPLHVLAAVAAFRPRAATIAGAAFRHSDARRMVLGCALANVVRLHVHVAGLAPAALALLCTKLPVLRDLDAGQIDYGNLTLSNMQQLLAAGRDDAAALPPLRSLTLQLLPTAAAPAATDTILPTFLSTLLRLRRASDELGVRIATSQSVERVSTFRERHRIVAAVVAAVAVAVEPEPAAQTLLAWEEAYVSTAGTHAPLRFRLACGERADGVDISALALALGTGDVGAPLAPTGSSGARAGHHLSSLKLGLTAANLTDLRLEDAVYNLGLQWKLLAAVDLPALRIFCLITSWPVPPSDEQPELLAWIARVWKRSTHLHTVRLWRVPGVSRLGLLAWPGAQSKRVLDFGWHVDDCSTRAAWLATQLANEGDRDAAARGGGAIGDDAGSTDSAGPSNHLRFPALHWLRQTTDRHGIAGVLDATGGHLTTLEAVVDGPFGDAEAAALARGAPRLRRLALTGASSRGLGLTAAGTRALAGLTDLVALQIVHAPQLAMGDLAAVGRACSCLTSLALALVGHPHNSPTLAALPDALEACRHLERLAIVQVGATVTRRILDALETLPRLRSVTIAGHGLDYSKAAVAAVVASRPLLHTFRLGPAEFAHGERSGRRSAPGELQLAANYAPSWHTVLDHWNAAGALEPLEWWRQP